MDLPFQAIPSPGNGMAKRRGRDNRESEKKTASGGDERIDSSDGVS
jgi:hypothetical protein